MSVLARLERAGLHLNRTKSAFMLPSIQYLGHVISAEGIKPSQEKVRALLQAPAPTDVQQLRSFLGAVNYYVQEIHTQPVHNIGTTKSATSERKKMVVEERARPGIH